MFGAHDLAFFAVSGLLLAMTPGPDTLYIVGRSSAQGSRAGAIAALGIGAGIFVHTAAAAVGISALLAASATAFTVLKIVGAGYLVYVGISMIRGPFFSASPIAAASMAPAALRKVFVQGFLTNVLNPKVVLFFLALLPQFVDEETPNKALALLFLGVLFNFIGTFWNLLVAWSAARVTKRLRRSALVSAWFSRCVGSLLVYVAIRIAFTKEG